MPISSSSSTEVGVYLVQVANHVVTAPHMLKVAELRLEAALDATGEDLPACRALIGAPVTAQDSYEKAFEIVQPAFDELRLLLVKAATE